MPLKFVCPIGPDQVRRKSCCRLKDNRPRKGSQRAKQEVPHQGGGSLLSDALNEVMRDLSGAHRQVHELFGQQPWPPI